MKQTAMERAEFRTNSEKINNLDDNPNIKNDSGDNSGSAGSGTGAGACCVGVSGCGAGASDGPVLTEALLGTYEAHLRGEERSRATIEKYLRSLRALAAWLGGRAVTKELISAWKEALVGEGRSPATVNAALSALNGLLALLGRQDCRVKFLKVQHRAFRDAGRELTQAEYERLVRTARGSGDERLALVLETIAGAGIRVSELRFITVEAVRSGRADLSLKGKIRTILLPQALCKKLLAYARAAGIVAGELFRGRGGKPLSRGQVWAQMKALCRAARVEPSKVFPHNLRHLFAVIFYKVYKDIARLADLLGHSSINTTRIYLATSGKEHQRQLEKLGLVQ